MNGKGQDLAEGLLIRVQEWYDRGWVWEWEDGRAQVICWQE